MKQCNWMHVSGSYSMLFQGVHEASEIGEFAGYYTEFSS